MLNFKSNYLNPELTNGAALKLLYVSIADALLPKLESVDFGSDIHLLKTKKNVIYDPFFSADKSEKWKEISSNFNRIQIGVPTHPATFFQHFWQKVKSKVELSDSASGLFYLSEVLSSQHSWRLESDGDFAEYGMITSQNKKFMISAYPKTLRLYPTKIEQKIRVSKLIIVTVWAIFALVSLLGGVFIYVMRTELLKILGFGK